MDSPITARRWRLAVTGALLGVLATFGLGSAAHAAPASPKPSNAAIAISGPTIKHTITYTQVKDPGNYALLRSEVAWMNGRAGDVMTSTTPDLGPEFVVTTFAGTRVTGRYELYPDVVGGPRAHRQALGSVKDAWFFAPVDMASTLAQLGIAMPTTEPDQQAFVKPTVPPANLHKSLAAIARESMAALALAAGGCVVILILLAFAARRSRSADRRRTLPPAMGRLAAAKAQAAAGAVLRSATPGRSPRTGGTVYRTPPGGGRAMATTDPAKSPLAGLPPRAATPAAATRASAAPSPAARLRRPPRQIVPGGMTPTASAAAAKRAADAKRAVEAAGGKRAVEAAGGKRAGWRGSKSAKGVPAPPQRAVSPARTGPAAATPLNPTSPVVTPPPGATTPAAD